MRKLQYRQGTGLIQRLLYFLVRKTSRPVSRNLMRMHVGTLHLSAVERTGMVAVYRADFRTSRNPARRTVEPKVVPEHWLLRLHPPPPLHLMTNASQPHGA